MDIDNDHSEEPAEWITAEKLEEIFPDMEYMLASSRHHLLPKEGKSARPRYHIYFPISEITDAEMYGNLKKALQKEYSFFDGNALDVARFIFGADCEEVLVHDGWMTIDEEIDVSEKYIEQKLVREVKKLGGLCEKWNSGSSGWPDRLVLLPDGKFGLVEVKAPGKKPRVLQEHRHDQLRSLGYKVFVLDDAGQIGGILDGIQTA